MLFFVLLLLTSFSLDVKLHENKFRSYRRKKRCVNWKSAPYNLWVVVWIWWFDQKIFLCLCRDWGSEFCLSQATGGIEDIGKHNVISNLLLWILWIRWYTTWTKLRFYLNWANGSYDFQKIQDGSIIGVEGSV